MIKKYRKKPVVIEAVQYDGNNGGEIRAWSGCAFIDSPVLEPSSDCPRGAYGQVTTLEGPMIASVGDFIIKGVKGEFYPCRPDIFAATYEEVAE
ncbi:MAG TPA: hypothetical protein PLL30_17295 [Candidatus Krumholzibacteria bacterium]|nr:hypothetical protein [Candidatus Krumholzibacteria bacterium]HRY42253.1 hypothetical protein [Candidatus Krumholzibacteria bacterium]